MNGQTSKYKLPTGPRNSPLGVTKESYPRTLILAKDKTARPVVGLPIYVAGRKVVKINMFFTSLGKSFLPLGSERMR